MRLIDLLPENYKKSNEVVSLQGAIGYWAEMLLIAKDDLLAQLNVSTATWGLSLWEKALGLETDISMSDTYRRTRVISKIRGFGTVSAEMIKNVAESFSNGSVDITENNAENRFTVTFSSNRGLPPNILDLKAAIEEIKPAHMKVIYIYIYTTWDEFEQYDYTWNQWDALNLTWNQLETYKE